MVRPRACQNRHSRRSSEEVNDGERNDQASWRVARNDRRVHGCGGSQEQPHRRPVKAARPIEEIVTIGRLRSTALDVVGARLEQDVVSDFLGAEAISRVGDSTVSLALRRVPGLTLVNDQFIYVRGLGERYSSVQLNGAQVPSPDLTRNVIPLDIFPTEIIDALSVQKGYSPEVPAAFGGGNVNIMTRGIPNGPVLNIEIGSGMNSDSNDDGLTYPGGGDDGLGTDDGTRAFPEELKAGLQTYGATSTPSASSARSTATATCTSCRKRRPSTETWRCR